MHSKKHLQKIGLLFILFIFSLISCTVPFFSYSRLTIVNILVKDYLSDQVIDDATIGIYNNKGCLIKKYKTKDDGRIDFSFISKKGKEYDYYAYYAKVINDKTVNSELVEIKHGKENNIELSTSISQELLNLTLEENTFDSVSIETHFNSEKPSYYFYQDTLETCTGYEWDYSIDKITLDNNIQNNVILKVAPNRVNDIFIKWEGIDTIRLDTISIDIGSEPSFLIIS